MSSHPNGPTLTNESRLPITDKPVLGGYQGKNNPLDQEFRPNITHDIRVCDTQDRN
jgi:hypothetical protein